MREHVYNVWFMVSPSRDVAGEWVAHCLELDVVSQGNSVGHALAMVQEACAMTLHEDLAADRDPWSRRAPEEYFEELAELVAHGERVPLQLALSDQSRKFIYAVPYRLVVGAQPVKAKAKAKGLAKTKRADVAFAGSESVAS